MVVTFDTTGLRRVDETKWLNPTNGDGIGLDVKDSPLAESAWLEDIPTMRRNLAYEYAELGCLIEAEPVVLGGVRGVCQVAKAPVPNTPEGRPLLQAFIANIFLAKASCHAVFGYIADEVGELSGGRETVIMAKLGVFGDGWVLPHPYAPELESKLPYHRGDDPAWDTQFPQHPLARAREWVRSVVATATVDPEFAALPDFVPSGPAPGTGLNR